MIRKIGSILLSIWMLSVTCLTAFAQSADFSALQPKKEGEMEPLNAVITSPLDGVSHLTNTADDYDVPQGIYFNGVKVKIVAVTETLGSYPVDLKDPGKLWARVVIGASEAYPGIIGMMPLANLSPDKGEDYPVQEGELFEDTALFLDNGLTDNKVGNFQKGTQLRVLGWFPEWMHVEIEGKAGFVRPEEVVLSPQTEEIMINALVFAFDEIQPGYQERYEAYMTELMKLYDKHGDSNHWPLEVTAEASKLAQKYGYLYGGVVNILPGENDLRQEDVLIKAREAALNAYGFNNWDSISLAYYYEPADPETHIWKASLWGAQDTPDVKVWLNQKGEVIGTLNAEEEGFEDMALYMDDINPEEALAEAKNSVEYYLFGSEATPGKDDLTEQEALDLAFKSFLKKFPDAKREEYKTESLFMTDFTEETRWWVVTLIREYTPEVATHYHMVFIGKNQEPAFESHMEFYKEDIKWAESMLQLSKLESEKGPFYTWSLEDKTSWDPEYFGLPQEGDIKQDAALELARNKVMSQYSLSDKDLEAFDTVTYFVLIPTRSWQISFVTKDAAPYSEAPGYNVIIDAATGTVDEVFSNEYMD